MVDPRVLHSITVEMCTGFSVLAGVAAVSKLLAGWYLKRFNGRLARLDRWAGLTSRLGDPASYFALGAGITATFLSMVTGVMVWPFDQLLRSDIVHNMVLIVAISQTVFIGAFIIRTRFKQLWTTRATAWVFVLLVVVGNALLTLQNSMAGHLSGKGSLLDDVLHYLRIDTHRMWLFPQWAVLPITITFPLVSAAFWLGLQLRRRGIVKMTTK